MDMISIISAKRDGHELSRDEIDFAVSGFLAGDIPDYQTSALLMAIMLRGMTRRETVDLTTVMIDSGRRLDLSVVGRPCVDKHSTGGVGDKTTLVVAPIVAACGVTVAKLSGRGLGHTGGTLDKLEAIPGLRTDLSLDELVSQAKRVGLAIAGQSAEIVPADKKIYALRDVTGTVASVPLITASVVSKKIAGGAAAIVLDVKVGSGAFMKSVEEARELARWLVEVTDALGARATALVTDMEQPLGRAIGNGLEVAEAVETLAGRGPEDLRELGVTLAAHMLSAAGREDVASATQEAQAALSDGSAQAKFAEMVEAQGGDGRVVHEPDGYLARPIHTADSVAEQDGFVTSIDAESIGRAAGVLGAGRRRAGEAVDPAAGVVLERTVGEQVEAEDVLAVLHTNRPETLEKAADLVSGAFVVGREPPSRRPLVLDIVG